jgi:hypothetical protein
MLTDTGMWKLGLRPHNPFLGIQNPNFFAVYNRAGGLVHPYSFRSYRLGHKVLTYVEYRAVSDVFQNIDPPPPSPLNP